MGRSGSRLWPNSFLFMMTPTRELHSPELSLYTVLLLIDLVKVYKHVSIRQVSQWPHRGLVVLSCSGVGLYYSTRRLGITLPGMSWLILHSDVTLLTTTAFMYRNSCFSSTQIETRSCRVCVTFEKHTVILEIISFYLLLDFLSMFIRHILSFLPSHCKCLVLRYSTRALDTEMENLR